MFFNLGFNDIPYNFMISSVGIFEGRGWDVQSENPEGKNLLMIGVFTDYLYKPGEMLSETLNNLTEDGKFLGKLTEDFELLCISDLCMPPIKMISRYEWNAEPRIAPETDNAQTLIWPITTVFVTDTTNSEFGSCDTMV